MNRYQSALIIIVLSVSFALGRYTVPTKVVTETKTVYVENQSEKTNVDKNKHKDTVTVEKINKDGTTTKTTHTVEDSKTDTKKDVELSVDSSTQTRKEVSRESLTNVSLLVGTEIISITHSLNYGLSISKPILGPISIGAFGFTSGLVGFQIGLNF
jgi:hypothetical protein